jgi:predicted small secreted protein
MYNIVQHSTGKRSDCVMKRVLTVLLLVACLMVTGCNTMKGLGKDIKKAGEAIEEAAK